MAGLSDDSAIAGRDMVIGQDLIDANIRPNLLARVVFRKCHTHPPQSTGQKCEETDHERCHVDDFDPVYEDREG
jgi:hypothetical protein